MTRPTGAPWLSVAIPVYNERATIETLLKRVHAIGVDKGPIGAPGRARQRGAQRLSRLVTSVWGMWGPYRGPHSDGRAGHRGPPRLPPGGTSIGGPCPGSPLTTFRLPDSTVLESRGPLRQNAEPPFAVVGELGSS